MTKSFAVQKVSVSLKCQKEINQLKLEVMETKTYNWVAVFGVTDTFTEMWNDYTEGAARRKAERRAKKWNCTVRIFRQTDTIINESLKVK